MKERPILFSGQMVRAILDNRKTQTRRIVRICDAPITKAESDACRRQKGIPTNAVNVRLCGGYLKCDAPPGSATVSSRVPCPYGQPDERLWVRESFFVDHYNYYPRGPFPKAKPPEIDDNILYAADGTCCEQLGECDCEGKGAVWRPSIHMPRWASRLSLEIIRIRVERLQDISEADAKAEGIAELTKDGDVKKYAVLDRGDYSSTPWARMPTTAKHAFERLWKSINGSQSWDANPYVWVVKFKRVTAPTPPSTAPLSSKSVPPTSTPQ